jgi:hypothetical protein
MKKKEILESRFAAHDSDAEQSVGEMDPHYIDWMKGDGEDGDESDAPWRKSRSKWRGHVEKKRKAAAAAAGETSDVDDVTSAAVTCELGRPSCPCPLGSGQGQRGQRSKGQNAHEKAEEEAAVLAAAPADSSAVPTPPEKENVRFDKKGTVVKRRGAGRTKGGALSGDESDGESVGNKHAEMKAARAAAKRASAKEVARQRERTCWCFCMLLVCEMRSDEIRLW